MNTVDRMPPTPSSERIRGESAERYAPIAGYRRIVIAVGDDASLFDSKTAMSLVRYRGPHCLAVMDGVHRGKTAAQLYGFGDTIPVVGALSEVSAPDALFVGISPIGGALPPPLRAMIMDGVRQGIDIVSGLHDFLADDPEILETARHSGSRLIDVRRNAFRTTASAAAFRDGCLRIHAVGHDCSVGKMVAMLEVERALRERGRDAKFLATGQTGIMIAGNGVPVDCVVADFVNGAVEQLVVDNERHDILLIEGQGSITHPAFSAVTLGLLHGCAPQGLILCFEAGRTHVKGLPHVALARLERYRELYESLATERGSATVIGVAMNGRRITPEQAEREKQDVGARLGLPVCDVYRDGPDVLADAVLNLQARLSP